MVQKHCPDCGAELIEKELKGEGIIPYCPHCEQYRFPFFNTAVSMIVINEEKEEILLIQQYGRPFYILVAGYVNRGEEIEHAAVREVKEETGLTADRIVFNRSRFYEPSNTLMCNFTVFVRDAEELCVNEEIDHCQWYSFAQARKEIKDGSLAEEFLVSYLDSIHR